MSGGATLLLALQHGDSFFPSGAIAFSNGLETLKSDAQVRTEEDVGRFVHEQLTRRWRRLDWGVIAAAWVSAPDVSALLPIDACAERLTLPAELREGSKRAGAALLGVHERLGTDGAGDFAARVAVGEAVGHLGVVQALVWKAVGLGLLECGLLSAHTLSVSILGAALRLGLIGHLGAQRILTSTRAVVASVVEAPPPALERAGAYTPLAEIAVMRHETQPTRLFSN